MISTTLSEQQFLILQKKAMDFAGITLSDSKKTMLANRLKPRMMILQLRQLDEYIGYLNRHEDEEKQNFINAITTTMSHFYREHHHYDKIIAQVKSLEGKHTTTFQYRIWSAGCSSGEEPYTMAILMKQAGLTKCDPKIIATDINTQMLVAAREGIYRWSDICDMPSDMIRDYFDSFKNELDQERYEVTKVIKNMVELKKVNLMKPFTNIGKLDVILCRNVMIYFDEPTRNNLVDRFLLQLKPGGLFVTGHSEVFDYQSKGLVSIGKTIYQKKG